MGAAAPKEDGGRSWFPTGPGLDAEEVRKVYSSLRGWLAALDGGGLKSYDEARRQWVRKAWTISLHKSSGTREIGSGEPLVNDMQFAASRWLAATSSGLFDSRDSGASWHSIPLPAGFHSADSVLRTGGYLWVMSSGGLFRSANSGRRWRWQKLPNGSGRVLRVASASGQLLAISDGGLYVSRDLGVT